MIIVGNSAHDPALNYKLVNKILTEDILGPIRKLPKIIKEKTNLENIIFLIFSPIFFNLVFIISIILYSGVARVSEDLMKISSQIGH